MNPSPSHTLNASGPERVGRRTIYFAAVVLAVLGGYSVLLPPHTYGFVALGGLFVLVLLFRSPATVLAVYLSFFLFWPQEWMPLVRGLPPFTERVVGWLAMSSVLLQFTSRKRIYFPSHPLTSAILLLFAGFSLSLLNTHSTATTFDALYRLLRLIVVFFLIVLFVDTRTRCRQLVWMFIIGTAILTVQSVNNYYVGGREWRMGIWRAVGPGNSYADPNSHAATIVYSIPLTLQYVLYTRRRLIAVVLLLIVGIALWNVVITGSRTGMVIALGALGGMVYQTRNRVVAITVAAIAIGLAVVFMPESYRYRFMSVIDPSVGQIGAQDSAMGRWRGFKDGLAMFLSSPLTGVGAGCYKLYRGDVMGIPVSAHNLYGELLGDVGALGAAAFSYLIVTVFATIRKIRVAAAGLVDRDAARFLTFMSAGIGLSYCLLLIQGIGGHNLYRYHWYLFAAMALVLHRLAMRMASEDPTDRKGRGSLEEPAASPQVAAVGHSDRASF